MEINQDYLKNNINSYMLKIVKEQAEQIETLKKITYYC